MNKQYVEEESASPDLNLPKTLVCKLNIDK